MTASSKQQAVSSKGTKDKRIAVTFFVFVCLLSTVFLPAVLTEAQPTGRVARIGYLDSSAASGSSVLLEAFRQKK